MAPSASRTGVLHLKSLSGSTRSTTAGSTADEEDEQPGIVMRSSFHAWDAMKVGEEVPLSPTSPFSATASTASTEACTHSSLLLERQRLRSLIATLKADVDRADQILQDMDPFIQSTPTPAVSSASCIRSPCSDLPTASSCTEQVSPISGTRSLETSPERTHSDRMQISMGSAAREAREMLTQAIKRFEAAIACEAAGSPAGEAETEGRSSHTPAQRQSPPPTTRRRTSGNSSPSLRHSSQGDRQALRRSSSLECCLSRKAWAASRGSTPEAPVHRIIRQPHYSAELRAELRSALAAGVSSSDANVAKAKALLQNQELRADNVRTDLKRALTDAEHPSLAARADIAKLQEIKVRLAKGLAHARCLGLSEEELQEAEFRRRRIHNLIEDLKGQIRVFCRVRPLNHKEQLRGDHEAVRVLNNMSLEVSQVGTFHFDAVFSPGSQEDIFKDCCNLIQSAVDGHNVTIFAYGQTGAGKTHTMYGTPEKEGIAPRAITELFQVIGSIQHRYSVSVFASMVELYNNRLVDLLRPVRSGGRGAPKLSVRQDGAGAVQVDQLAEEEVQDAVELKELLDRGIAQRTVAANAMNIESSRSHLVFTIRVTSINKETHETLKGKILLCDLGGSERLKKTEATGKQRKEAIEINKSLTALGDVIEAVAKKQKQVPYRNHKLTQIMQDSLGGTAKTLMFVNCSPAWSSLHESVMALTYAARVKRITNLGRIRS